MPPRQRLSSDHSLTLVATPADEPRSCERQRVAAFAVLYVTDFPLQAILRTAPDLADRPVALLEDDRKRAKVVALTRTACAQGVELGLTAPQAQARCSELIVRTPQPAAEAEARAALLAAAFTLSPLVEATAPGVVTIDVAALPVDRRESMLQHALDQLAALGLLATGGLAATPLLALYAARTLSLSSFSLSFSPLGGQPNRLGGDASPYPQRKRKDKEKEERAEPYRVVTDSRAFLAPLPLATADPPPEIAAILATWGLRTLGDLTALPKAEIVQRLGPAGLELWERAAGETIRPLNPIAPPRTFEAVIELENPVETLEPLLFLLRRFIDRLALELRAAGLVAAELKLMLPLEDETQHVRAFRLPDPTAEPEILFRTLHSHLETVHTDAAVVGVRLVLEPTRPLARQHGLFDTGLRDPHGFAETLARAVALVGSGRVGTPRCDDTHRPDAVTLEPPAAIVPSAAPPEVLPPLGLPLRRFRPPLPAKIELAQIETVTGVVDPGPASTRPATGVRPAYVWTNSLHGAVIKIRGPWRGSGDWWQPETAWEREEWDVTLANGGLYRIVRTPQGWWLEGEYD
jgi:protein ImuB